MAKAPAVLGVHLTDANAGLTRVGALTGLGFLSQTASSAQYSFFGTNHRGFVLTHNMGVRSLVFRILEI